jgi:hypothetical protein
LEEDAGAESSALCRAVLKVKPTFSRNGQEIWVTIRGETRIAILDTDVLQHLRAEGGSPVRQYLDCVNASTEAGQKDKASSQAIAESDITTYSCFAVFLAMRCLAPTSSIRGAIRISVVDLCDESLVWLVLY